MNLAACGGGAAGDGEPPGVDAGLTPAELWERVEACGLAGDYRVEAAEVGSCDAYPAAGEVVSIAFDGERPVLRAGALELELLAERGECELVAAGCSHTDDDYDERYFAPEMIVSASAGGVVLEASAIDVLRGYVGPCSDASVEATRIAACDPIGSYEAAADAPIASGACDLSWSAGTVTVSAGETGGYDLSWSGTEINGLVLDEASCTLSGARGVDDFWLYNSAMRTVEIELAVSRDGLGGTAIDSLEGETFDGKSCAGATFSLDATRPAARDAERFAVTCDVAQPPACGDAVCEDGESCTCADCACTGADQCAPDGVCRASCALESEASDCAAGQRCSPSTDGTAIFPTDDLYCVEAGAGIAGDECARNDDCGAGLICHVSAETGRASCALPCGDGFPMCGGDEVCGAHGDGSGSGYYPTAMRGCEHRAGLAEDCSVDACADGLTCLKTCINGDCEHYCTRTCGGGCPAELPVCNGLGVCSKS